MGAIVDGEVVTLPGDMVALCASGVEGMAAGVGYARQPPIWMQPGDTIEIEIEIEGIGILANTIEDEA